jgi:hypothetical protein
VSRFRSLLILLAAGCTGVPGTAEAPRNVTLTRTIRIPVTSVTDAAAVEAQSAAPERLLVRPGDEDELPHGPTGFDVRADGSIVITDPLRERLMFVGSEGGYVGQAELGFEPSSVTLGEGEGMRVLSEATGGAYALESASAAPRMLPPVEATRTAAAEDRVTLASPTQARVALAEAGARGIAEIDVRFEEEGARLVSVGSLGADAEGSTYVVLETTRGGATVDVSKRVRKYSPEGKLVAEITDVEIDYFVHPVDEFRVQDGLVYQLVPREDEVLIRIWDTNP